MVNFCLNMNPPLNFSIYDFLPVLSLLPDLSLAKHVPSGATYTVLSFLGDAAMFGFKVKEEEEEEEPSRTITLPSRDDFFTEVVPVDRIDDWTVAELRGISPLAITGKSKKKRKAGES